MANLARVGLGNLGPTIQAIARANALPPAQRKQALQRLAAEQEKIELRQNPGIFPDPVKAIKNVGRAIGAVTHGQVKKAVQHLGDGVNNIAGAHAIQAVFPTKAIPAAIFSAAASHGPKGALDAAHNVVKNPVTKAAYMAAGIAFPPFAPLSAGAIGAMEGSSRLLDGLESGNPKAVASAAFSIAATTARAKAGDAGAARAVQSIDTVRSARELLSKVSNGNKGAQSTVDALRRSAATSPAAKSKLHTYESVAARAALKGSLPSEAVNALHKNAPSLMAMVATALRSPAGVKIGDFSVLSTGRVLHKGKPMPKPAKKKGLRKK